MKYYIRLILICYTCSLVSQVKGQSKGASNSISIFLKSFNTGNIDSINAFIKGNYHEKALENKEAFSKTSTSFGTMFDEFGELELHSSKFDSTYKSTKYYLIGKYTKEWVCIMFVKSKDNEKILGQGIWKLEKPIGAPNAEIKIKNLPGYLDSYLQNLSEHNLFSGSILVAHANKIIYNRTFGNKSSNVQLKDGSQYPIASVTKLFTGIAIAQLEDKGLISKSDPISKYIKEYPTDISNQVTIKHLLLHTSGIEMDDCLGFRNQISKVKNLNELLSLQVKYIDSLNDGRRLNFKPLNSYDYSNEEYDLLGVIIERVSGLTFDEYIRKNICNPLGMNETNYFSSEEISGYSHYSNLEYKPTIWYQYPFGKTNSVFASSGLFSTPSDLYKLFEGLQNKKLLKNQSTQRLMADTVTISKTNFYGYGLEGNAKGYLSYGHNGGNILGTSAEFRYFPELDLFIAVLCNRTRSAPDLIYHLKERILK